ncbi:MAG: hypothetical protein H0T51_18295 [Pirellulales bacterium]|nr:hypothetical protein [Pirellulales bacterium]
MAWTFITTTSYGSWVPGDARGYVQRGEILPPAPPLARHATSLLKSPPVRFSDVEQNDLFNALTDAAVEFGYLLTDVSVESWHLHWIVQHDDDIAPMAGRLKNRMRQQLNRGRIWTEGYHFDELLTDAVIVAASNYIARHAGARLIKGVRVKR